MNVVITNEDAEIAVSMIDVLATRGSFKGEELLAVGSLRVNLIRSLEIAKSSEQATSEEQEIPATQDPVSQGDLFLG